MYNVIDGVSDAVTLANASVETLLDTTIVYADGLGAAEFVEIYRLGPSGAYIEATNKFGRIVLSKYPNTVELPAATYKFVKAKTATVVHVGYEV
jgi:hypothetical protein